MELGGENEVGEYGEEALMKWKIQRKWRRACCNLCNATQYEQVAYIAHIAQITNL